jgi:hypothetical protein
MKRQINPASFYLPKPLTHPDQTDEPVSTVQTGEFDPVVKAGSLQRPGRRSRIDNQGRITQTVQDGEVASVVKVGSLQRPGRRSRGIKPMSQFQRSRPESLTRQSRQACFSAQAGEMASVVKTGLLQRPHDHRGHVNHCQSAANQTQIKAVYITCKWPSN